MTKIQRTTFKTSRAAQYVERRALQAMTGQPIWQFASVVAKELMDNALDACETVGVAPEVTLAVQERADGSVAITVTDNADGIPPETVHDALDFNVLVSDKAAYRSPTRGAQGNALKTVFGIPYALGSLEPVVIEGRGLRHEARVWKDPAGQLRVQCDDTDMLTSSGTAITALIPTLSYLRAFDPEPWVRAFALFNPHALVKVERFESLGYLGSSDGRGQIISEHSYRPTRDPAKRFKYLPSDPTSPHWYDMDSFKKLIYSHIGHHRHEGGEDLLLRDFVRQFKGLSATKKAKVVCAELAEIKTLSDFEDAPHLIAYLLEGMQLYSDAPAPTTLGTVGKEHFERRFKEFYGDLLRFDYKKHTGTLMTGMPYVVEFAIAETVGGGDFFTAVNYSPTFDDPLEDLRFQAKPAGISADGVAAFLEEGYAHPDHANADDPAPPSTAVALHVITPAPLFLDLGKTRLEGFTDESEGTAIGNAIFSKIKPYLTEGKRRVKGQRAQERAKRRPGEKEMSLKDATFAVMDDAWSHATDNGRLPVGARRFFYAVRRRIPDLTNKRFHPEKGYKYFSQTLLPEYQQRRVDAGMEPLAGVYYDPRGKLYEAHTGKEMDLGTHDVETYEFPPYTFNKLLYVEKRGQVPLLQAAKISERYDMALVTEAGFSTVAARTLLSAGAEGQKYQIFCLHDADYPGYNILRTLREATARMPEHSMEVYDIGLTVEQVLEAGKEPEEYTRSSKVPEKLIPTLNDVEREWFIGEQLGEKQWKSKRFELDDLTAPELIEHIERRLEELGVEPKVIPPNEVLAKEGEKLHEEKVGEWIDEIIAEMLGVPALKKKIAKEFKPGFKLQGAEAWIKTTYKRDDSQSWRAAVKATLQAAYDAKHKDAIEEAVRKHTQETVADEDE